MFLFTLNNAGNKKRKTGYEKNERLTEKAIVLDLGLVHPGKV